MSRMVRKQVYVGREHEELLKRRARELDVAESELIRRGIEQIGRSAPAGPLDRRAWQEELDFIRRRASIPASGRGRKWTREDLYDQRLQRLPR